MLPIRDYTRRREELDEKRNLELSKVASRDDPELTCAYESRYGEMCDELEGQYFGFPLITQTGEVKPPGCNVDPIARFWAFINLIHLPACLILKSAGEDAHTLGPVFDIARDLNLLELVPENRKTVRTHSEVLDQLAKISDALAQKELLEEQSTKSATTEVKLKTVQSRDAKRSWTQADLDEAIGAYKAERAGSYRDLVKGVKEQRPGALKAATKVFGRNALVRHFGVKSRDMVSKSPVWQTIRDDLGLHGPKRGSLRRRKRIGEEIAHEEYSVAHNEAVLDQVVNRETIEEIRKWLPQKEAESLIEDLVQGKTTDERARGIAELARLQHQDDQSNFASSDI